MIENIIYELYLPLLERVGKDYHFRCVLCGDSAKSATKKRGWIYVNGTKATYKCYNCGKSMPILTFLKLKYPDAYKRYIKILFGGKKKSRKGSALVENETTEVDTTSNQKQELNLKKLSQLPKDHEAATYFQKRKMPPKFLKYFYWAENYRAWINEDIIPGKFEKVPETDPRIVIPFYSAHKKIFAIQGRAVGDVFPRYITIKLDESHKKIFGLERLNPHKPIPVFEGPFDSIFIPNSIAFGGADLDLNYLETLASQDKFIFCYDNEPRNKQMCDRIETVLKRGFKVSLLPASMKKYGKDINDYILAGMTRQEICAIIKENIVCGKMGLVKFKIWKKGK